MLQFNNKPPKKLAVKNVTRRNKAQDEEYEAMAMSRISATIDAVLVDAVELPFGCEEIYRTCESLCRFHVAGSIYRMLYEKCEAAAIKLASELKQKLHNSMDEIGYLQVLEHYWANFTRQYRLLENLFLHLDRVYIPQHPLDNLLTIWKFGVNFFRNYAILQSDLPKNLITNLIGFFEKWRSDKSGINEEQVKLVRAVVSMLREVDEYSRGTMGVESKLLDASESFYEREAESRRKEQVVIADYLKFVVDALEFEGERVGSVLAPSSKTELMKRIEGKLVTEQLNFIFAGATVKVLFVSKDWKSFGYLYDLINRVYSIDRLKTEFTVFVKSFGIEMIKESADDRVIEGVIEFKQQLDRVIEGCFGGSETIKNTLKDSFSTFINTEKERTSQLLALYIHQRFQQKLPIGEVDDLQSTVLLLFRYLIDKDYFETFYRKTLAQRLLFGLSGDWEVEKAFIASLRGECGIGFTTKMEAMFKDLEVSKDLAINFAKVAKESKFAKLAEVTTVTVVNDFWPIKTASPPKLKLSKMIGELEETFTQFYLDQNPRKRMTWNESLGHCVIRGNYPMGSKDLVVSVQQALVLLQFNSGENTTMTFGQLRDACDCEVEGLKETLSTLITVKYPVLVKEPSTGTVLESDKFTYNQGFSCEIKKIPLYLLQSPFLKVEEEFIAHSSNDNEKDAIPLPRASKKPALAPSFKPEDLYRIDCMLVRHLKQVKQISRKDLVSFVVANVGLPLRPQEIEDRIDNIIGKEYAQVDKDNSKNIIYLP